MRATTKSLMVCKPIEVIGGQQHKLMITTAAALQCVFDGCEIFLSWNPRLSLAGNCHHH
jgi:hypothetical protein